MAAPGQKIWDEPGDRQEVWSTVLFADMVGYSHMMAEDERGVIDFMVSCSRMVNDLGRRYGGVLAQTTGDGFLLLFDTTAGALLFGREFHQLVAKRQENAPLSVQFRVGIHVGPVSRLGGMFYGNAVNIAARLEGIAKPGTCVVSQEIYEETINSAEKIDIAFKSIGSPVLKNIPERIALYQTNYAAKAAADIAEKITTVSAIGELVVRTSDSEVVFSSKQKLSALLGFLALSSSRRESNKELASILWPDRSAPAARRAFNDCKRRLVRQLGRNLQHLVHSERHHTGLNEIRFETDLGATLADLRQGNVPRYLVETPRWPDLILKDFERVSSVYKTWLKVMRTFWQAEILDELGELLIRTPPEHKATLEAARAVLNLEPGNEIASAMLIRHFTVTGNRAAASSEYKRVKNYLAQTHGLRPSARVEEARTDIGTLKSETTKPRNSVSTKPRRLIHLSVETFSMPNTIPPDRTDGFRAELVSNLARFREWSVTDNDGQGAHLEEVRNTRGNFSYSIGGTVSKTGVLRLFLRDLTTSRLIWSSEVTLNTDTWVATQRAAVGRIAAHLETYISADRLAQVIGVQERKPTSHDTWLEAEMIFSRWTPEAAQEATTLLQEVIAEDPGFAAAHSSLASYANVRHILKPGTTRDADLAKSAHTLAQRAVELDQLDARNHLAVAWTAALTAAFDRAALHLDMAATLNPNGQSTLISCAMAYAFIGQVDKGEALIDHVERIAPMLSEYQWCYVASVRFLSGRYEDALSAALKSGDRIVDNQGWIAASLMRLGRKDEAKVALDNLIDAVRPVWGGQESPTAEAVFDWFINAYPIRNRTARAHLADSLGQVLRGQ